MRAVELGVLVPPAAQTTESATRRSWRRRAAWRLGAAAIASTATWLVAGGVRVTGHPDALLLVAVGGAACFAVIAFVVALGRDRDAAARPLWQLAALIVLLPLVLWGWKSGWSAALPATLQCWAG